MGLNSVCSEELGVVISPGSTGNISANPKILSQLCRRHGCGRTFIRRIDGSYPFVLEDHEGRRDDIEPKSQNLPNQQWFFSDES